jgi:hypothetical protein
MLLNHAIRYVDRFGLEKAVFFNLQPSLSSRKVQSGSPSRNPLSEAQSRLEP